MAIAKNAPMPNWMTQPQTRVPITIRNMPVMFIKLDSGTGIKTVTIGVPHSFFGASGRRAGVRYRTPSRCSRMASMGLPASGRPSIIKMQSVGQKNLPLVIRRFSRVVTPGWWSRSTATKSPLLKETVTTRLKSAPIPSRTQYSPGSVCQGTHLPQAPQNRPSQPNQLKPNLPLLHTGRR